MGMIIQDTWQSWSASLKQAGIMAALRWFALAVLIVQVVRLFWVVVTPVGSFGDWQARQANIPPMAVRQTLFSTFDPFSRTQSAASGGQVVTSLSLSLFGIRLNEGSGLGSAIIAGPDGVQNSYATGDEILPGVRLKSVHFDHVVIDRGGVQESLFIDQSQPTESVSPTVGEEQPVDSTAQATPASDALTAQGLQSDVALSPRTQAGRVTGLVVSPKGSGNAFRTAGFKPGDIIVQVNGRPISGAGDIQALTGQIAPGARISIMVERGAQVVPLALTLAGQ